MLITIASQLQAPPLFYSRVACSVFSHDTAHAHTPPPPRARAHNRSSHSYLWTLHDSRGEHWRAGAGWALGRTHTQRSHKMPPSRSRDSTPRLDAPAPLHQHPPLHRAVPMRHHQPPLRPCAAPGGALIIDRRRLAGASHVRTTRLLPASRGAILPRGSRAAHSVEHGHTDGHADGHADGQARRAARVASSRRRRGVVH